MADAAFDAKAFPDKPEIVIGFVAPIGTPLILLEPVLVSELEKRDYKAVKIRVSDFTRIADPNKDVPAQEGFVRYHELMNLGNFLRRKTRRNDILALFTAARIGQERPTDEPRHLGRTAILVSQLKHPEEVFRLRRLYGNNFVLLGVNCPGDERHTFLVAKGMTDQQASELIARDEDEKVPEGQRVSDTFHLADMFISVPTSADDSAIRLQVQRLLHLLFGTAIVTPTRDEFAMFLANAASMRSASLARQVGAALFTEQGDLAAIGANEVPSPKGGLYWGDEVSETGNAFDARDHVFGFDMSDRMKYRVVEEILSAIEPQFGDLNSDDRKKKVEAAIAQLKGTRVANLTEFARAVHAEMDVLVSAARVGVSPRGGTLYVTTFPCHGCAKHVVAAGIRKVIFIEPYPKSMALDMHRDAIHLDGEAPKDGKHDWVGKEPPDVEKVHFAAFVGVAPRRYQELFSRTTSDGRRAEVKDKAGMIKQAGLGLRLPASPFSYVFREDLAAAELLRIKEAIGVNPQGHFALD